MSSWAGQTKLYNDLVLWADGLGKGNPHGRRAF